MSTKKVASYEEACKVLNIKPISEDAVNAFPQEDRKSLLAYHKLTIIARALNEGWLPDWNNTNQRKYYPIFQYTYAGLSYAHANCAASYTYAHIGSRLCFYDHETAEYAANTFRDLYTDYYCLTPATEQKKEQPADKEVTVEGFEEGGSEFLKEVTKIVENKIIPLIKAGNSNRGAVLIITDLDSRTKDGEKCDGTMLAFAGNGGALLKGVTELIENKQGVELLQTAIRAKAFGLMMEKVKNADADFFKSLLTDKQK